MSTIETVYRVYLGMRTKHGDNIPPSAVRSWVIAALRDAGIDGATLFRATGLWRGESEETLVVEVANADYSQLRDFARSYCGDFDQEAVMILTLPNTGLDFVEP